MDKVSYVGNADVSAIEHLYKSYLENPDNVDLGWQKFFEGFDFARTNYDTDGDIPENFKKEVQVLNLINGYRTRGHLFTKTNPVRERRKYLPTLALENFGLSDADLNTVFQAGNEIGIGATTLAEIVKHLEKSYCSSIGFEYMYVRDPETVSWLQSKIEAKDKLKLSQEQKIEILTSLDKAVGFEGFLNKKYVGQKRFSIEGVEALVPALNHVISKGSELGVECFVMGMAHRGRLNTLTNIFQKRPQDIFSEFEGKEFDSSEDFDGDVKYHQGYNTKVTTAKGKDVELILSPNPSHLETVDSVVQGIARAKIDQQITDETKVCTVMMHGDAAIAGQGVVYEVVQMAQLKGYRVGGTLHIITNNQVGFTTNFTDARSSTYCTGVAQTTLAPVLHVNADDVEAVIEAIELAIEYKQRYRSDIFVDLLGYRKYGHNEGDEPKFTQPSLYKIIAKHPNLKEIYFKQLVAEGVVSDAEMKTITSAYNDFLEGEFETSKKADKALVWKFLKDEWKGFRASTPQDFEKSPETGVSKKELLALAEKITKLPEGKTYFRKIAKILEDRYNAITSDQLDWGSAEMLAYATILEQGMPVRISGQDCERGTFSHRHAVVKTEDTEEEVITLNNINDKQANFSIYNSLLSEYAVLGFEYGYSLATPKGLTIWEAQFGDFANGAQIMTDQFITAGEDKWDVQSNLVMLLPHGYEGQGAEHSSARLERFLQMSADYNIQVINPTTPANNFHALRRQVARDFRKPLVVVSPKMLLRYPAATSTLDELANGSFQEVIDDKTANKKEIDTIVLCSGKFYYEAKEKAQEIGVSNMAFVRVEQLYPLPQTQIDAVIASYPNAKNIIWAQEEPENMGAWRYMAMAMRSKNLIGITRPASAATAEGSKKLHEKRLANLYKALFQYAKITVQ
ncbi:MAG TPA: 2-oxoglutarate dehydrogenase E1 component [Crocinitomicaceae bacterium]|nr:2-oxoglutarate dehydrogenase E1 component [Crocinitomicaceae bacterium]